MHRAFFAPELNLTSASACHGSLASLEAYFALLFPDTDAGLHARTVTSVLPRAVLFVSNRKKQTRTVQTKPDPEGEAIFFRFSSSARVCQAKQSEQPTTLLGRVIFLNLRTRKLHDQQSSSTSIVLFRRRSETEDHITFYTSCQSCANWS